jgi:hypothetical protein
MADSCEKSIEELKAQYNEEEHAVAKVKEIRERRQHESKVCKEAEEKWRAEEAEERHKAEDAEHANEAECTRKG